MAEKELGKLTVRVDMDGTGFQRGISDLNRQMRVAQSEFQKASAKIGDFGKSTEGLRLRADSLNQQIGIQRQRVAALAQAHAASAQAKGADAKETQNLAIRLNKAQAALFKMERELKDVNEQIERKSSVWHRLGQRLESAGNKMETIGSHMANVGRSMSMYITAPLTLAAGASIKFAVDFESAFAGVRKTVDATEAEFSAFKQEIRDMAKTIPATTEEIARVAEAAGQLGIQKDALMGFTRTMVDLGVATNMTSDEAATALARLANITQMSQKDFDRLGATVVALGNNLATTESEIVEMALRLAGAGHQVGMTEAQILSFAGALSSLGINAEAGGSAFSRAFINIANAVDEGGEKLQLFAKVAGMTTDEFVNRFKKDAADAVIAFVEGLGRMRDSGENVFATLEKLGLSEILLRDALLRAAGAGDLLRESIELGSQAWEENNALTKEASERYKTAESQFKILWNRIKDVGITLGEALVPALLKVLDNIDPLIDMIANLANWFADLSPGMQQVIIVAGGLAVALGPIIMIIGDLVAAIGGVVSILGIASGAMASAGGAGAALGGALAALTGPVGLIVAGIAALVAAGTALYLNWEKLNERYPRLMKVLSYTNPLFMVVNAIKRIEDAFSDAIPEVDLFGDKVSKSTKKALGSYFELEKGAMSALKRLYWSGDVVTKDTAEKIAGNFDQMASQIIEGMNKKQEEATRVLGNWFKAEAVLPQSREKEILQKLNNHYEEQRKQVEKGEKRIKEIMETASKERRSITSEEFVEIQQYMYNFRTQAIENLTKSEQEQRIIRERIANQNREISAREAADIVRESKKATDQVIKDAQKVRDEKIAWAIKARDELGIISDEEAQKLIANANLEYDKTVEKAKQRHQDVVNEAKAQAREHVNEVDWETGEILSKWEVAKNNLANTWDNIVQNAKNKWGELKGWASKEWESIKRRVEEKVENMRSSVNSKMEQVRKSVIDKWERAKKYLSNIDLRSVGWMIIDSLTGGMASRAKSLYDKAREIANNVKSTIERALDMRSPSRVMMEIGRNIGEGMAIGMRQTLPKITDQARMLAGAVIPRADFKSSRSETVGNVVHFASAPVEIRVMLDGQQIMPTIRRELTFDLEAALKGVK